MERQVGCPAVHGAAPVIAAVRPGKPGTRKRELHQRLPLPLQLQSSPCHLCPMQMQVLQLKGELRDVKEELAATSLALSRSQAECAALRRSVKSPSAPPQPAEAAQAPQRQPRRVQGSGTPHPSHASQRAQASRLAQPRCKPAQHTSEAATPKAATRRHGGRLAARRKARHPSAASSSTAPAKPPAASSRETAAAPALSRPLPRRRKCRRKGEGAKLREKAKRLSPSGEERAPPRDVSSRPPLAPPTGPSKPRSPATPPPPPPLAARAQSPEAMQEAPLSVQHLRQAYERLKQQAQAHDVRAGRLQGMAERPGVEEEQGPDPIRTFSLD